MIEPSFDPTPRALSEQLDLGGGPARRRRWILAACAAALLAGAAILSFRGGADPVRYRTQAVRRGTLTVMVTATGTLYPTNQVDVSSELSGVVTAVEVTYNQRVTKGQVLVRLDTTKLEAQAGQNRAGLVSAQAKVLQAQATEEETRLKLERLQQVRDRSGGKVPAPADVDAAVASLERARADLASARASEDQARATLQATLVDIKKAVIRSPVEGVVLKRSIEPGQTVAATLEAPVLLTVAEDLRRMELRVDVDEADVGRVKAGQEARFTVDAFQGRTFSARVAQVRLGATTTSGVVTYTTVLTVDNDDLALFPGMTATAQVVVERDEDALLVPSAALRFVPSHAEAFPKAPGSLVERLMPHPPRPNGKAAPDATDATNGARVHVLRDGALVAIPVTTGSSNGEVTRITGGDLAPGTEVVVAAARASP